MGKLQRAGSRMQHDAHDHVYNDDLYNDGYDDQYDDYDRDGRRDQRGGGRGGGRGMRDLAKKHG